MILHKRIGDGGRAGNQLFSIASVIGLARQFGHDYRIPPWNMAEYFEHDFQMEDVKFFDRALRENGFHYDEEFWKQNLQHPNEIINIEGYLQSDKYWGEDRLFAQKLFKFKSIPKLDKVLPKGKNIALHIRRGDYVGNPNYYNLGSDYYKNALKALPKGSVIIFSDDYNYCRDNFHGIFLEGYSDIEHLYLMTKCDHFIVSNSTFSWWGAYLGQKKDSVVIHPDRYFCGRLETHDTSDFWPKEWKEMKAAEDRDDLSDVTFVIPISFDSKQRKKNAEALYTFLVKNFRTKIILGENGMEKFKYLEKYSHKYVRFDYPYFHRTRMINEMVKMADTKIVAVIDSDVLIPKGQLITAAHEIRSGGADITYPYEHFIRCKEEWTERFTKDAYRVNAKNGIYENMWENEDKESFGGCFFVNKEAYLGAGGENENFISFGREDVERYIRFKKLGLTVTRTEGSLYHLWHPKTLNSTIKHPHYAQNREECRKVADMESDELRIYVDNGFRDDPPKDLK
jgi:hypothetical protein